MRRTGIAVLTIGALSAAIAGYSVVAATSAAETIPLSQVSHIHGIAVDPEDASRLYLATHHGLYRTSIDGAAERVSQSRDDLMGFTPHPTDKKRFYASGHPSGGGNLGLIISADAGRTWQPLARGVNGPVDFHAMDVSAADPRVIYGLFRGIQVSRNGGQSWEVAGPAPGDVFDLAASAKDPNTVYAATRGGLLVSRDAGQTWQPAATLRAPASMIQTTPDGTIYAFVVGRGLVKATEPDLAWQEIGGSLGQSIVLHLAADPNRPGRLFAVTQDSAVLVSSDDGGNWIKIGG